MSNIIFSNYHMMMLYISQYTYMIKKRRELKENIEMFPHIKLSLSINSRQIKQLKTFCDKLQFLTCTRYSHGTSWWSIPENKLDIFRFKFDRIYLWLHNDSLWYTLWTRCHSFFQSLFIRHSNNIINVYFDG